LLAPYLLVMGLLLGAGNLWHSPLALSVAPLITAVNTPRDRDRNCLSTS